MNNTPLAIRLFKAYIIGFALCSTWVFIACSNVSPFNLPLGHTAPEMIYVGHLMPVLAWVAFVLLGSRFIHLWFLKNWHRTVKNWVVGIFIYFIAVLQPLLHFDINQPEEFFAWGDDGLSSVWYALLIFVVSAAPMIGTYALDYVREMPWYRHRLMVGQLSARFGGLYSFSRQQIKIDDKDRNKGKTDHLFLGRTFFKDDPFFKRNIGVSSDSNLVTIGMIGSGKATTSVWHNLAMYQGSMIVFDPKGEHARMTFKRRQSWSTYPGSFWNDIKGSSKVPATSIMLDPFGVNAETNIPASRYNLLADIDLTDESEAMSLIRCIADGCIVTDPKHPHFSDHARKFITALIGHVLTTYPKESHTLPFVHDLFYGTEKKRKKKQLKNAFNDLLLDMVNNQALGKQVSASARDLLGMGENELGSVLSTISRGLGWIAEPAMREQLSNSDFSLKEFGIKRVEAFEWRQRLLSKDEKISLGYRDQIETLYIVLPFERMQEEPRWMRVLSSLSVRLLISQGLTVRRPDHPTTVLLDEFAQLGGRVDSVVNAFNISRGAGLKLWIMLQNLGQIQGQYPDNWNDIISGSTVQLFGVNDNNTAKYFSERLGRMVMTETTRKSTFGKTQTEKHANDLMSHDNLMDDLNKGSNHQLIFRPNGRALHLERVGFKTYTDKDENTFYGIETTTEVEHVYDVD